MLDWVSSGFGAKACFQQRRLKIDIQYGRVYNRESALEKSVHVRGRETARGHASGKL